MHVLLSRPGAPRLGKPTSALPLLLAAVLTGGTLAQPAATRQGRYRLAVPAGAKTLVVSRGNSALALTELPAGLKQVTFKLSVSAAKYSDTLTTASGSATTRFVGPFALSPVPGGALKPALNTWKLLWNSTQPGTSSFTFTLNGKAMTGSEAAQPFKVRVLFSNKTPTQLKSRMTLRPPRIP
ncbi:hypothetical protein [Deinococcus alpinitundrae]|uniref:hypothetical protein n=1 Tax=Deinococcus alpinitundrae TaxID=468913 RepID=UPI0013795821|nr:hypothetical protein [Deinococcus alpinitundrae]